MEVPKYFIEGTVLDAISLGISDLDAKFCVDFLLNRRSELLRLIKEYKEVFHNVKQENLPGLA